MSDINESQEPTIGVMSVATNLYFDYWKKMVLSADKHSVKSDRVTFFVFTEQIDKIEKFSNTLKNVEVKGIEISPYGWPEATLLRYQIFCDSYENMKTDILMHLDADMFIASNPWKIIKQLLNKNQVCLIQHPGFWRDKGMQRLLFYMVRPLMAYRDLRMKLKLGGIGAWETHTSSLAFVPREFRNNYYCGGTWFGRREKIGIMMEKLSNQVSDDSKNGVIAKWHDESHLNQWATQNRHSFYSPELCFDETYPQLRKLKPQIIAVRKKEKTR